MTESSGLRSPRYTAHVWGDVERILIDRKQIAARVKVLAAEISRDLEALSADGEVVLIPILTGSIIFVADLMRELPHKLQMNLVTVSSYPGKSMKSKGAQLASALPDTLEGRHALVIDDILDSGGTIRLIRDIVSDRRPASLRTCVLLRKTIPSALATPCEYVGFDIPDEFVVGYGLDYDDYYRNLPDIGILKEEAL